MKIRTNNVPRPLLAFSELNADQRTVAIAEFDLDAERQEYWKGFVFKGELYQLDDFVKFSDDSEEKKAGWDGVMGQSAFHAILVKLDMRNLDSVVVGQMFC